MWIGSCVLYMTHEGVLVCSWEDGTSNVHIPDVIGGEYSRMVCGRYFERPHTRYHRSVLLSVKA